MLNVQVAERWSQSKCISATWWSVKNIYCAFYVTQWLDWEHKVLHFTQDEATPHFALTDRAWLTVIFLFGGLGEKQQNALREVSNLSLRNFSCGFGLRKMSTNRHQWHRKSGTKNWRQFIVIFLYLWKKYLVCAFKLAAVCTKRCGLC